MSDSAGLAEMKRLLLVHQESFDLIALKFKDNPRWVQVYFSDERGKLGFLRRGFSRPEDALVSMSSFPELVDAMNVVGTHSLYRTGQRLHFHSDRVVFDDPHLYVSYTHSLGGIPYVSHCTEAILKQSTFECAYEILDPWYAEYNRMILEE
jgi:hypothetical protein